MAPSHPESLPASARLYLVAPPCDRVSDLGRVLGSSLDDVDVAAVLLRLPQADERMLLDYVTAIVAVTQPRGVALLLDGRPELVAPGGADGAHVTGLAALSKAIEILKPDRVVGAGGLKTRHDAMTAGERGADYVMFGEPDGHRPRFDLILERVAWWAELFQVPCVGFSESLDEISPLAAAGADFVALGAFVFSDLQRTSHIIRTAAERLKEVAAKPR